MMMLTKENEGIMVLEGEAEKSFMLLDNPVHCLYSGILRNGMYLMSSAFSVLSGSIWLEPQEVRLVTTNYIAPVSNTRAG